MVWEHGRLSLIWRDDDMPGGPADRAFETAAAGWRAEGYRFAIVTPSAVRLGNKGDLNDTIRTGTFRSDVVKGARLDREFAVFIGLYAGFRSLGSTLATWGDFRLPEVAGGRS